MEPYHRLMAWIGIGSGALVAGAAAVLVHRVWEPNQGQGGIWTLVALVTCLLMAWGGSHLAQGRGYNDVIAYSLLVFAILLTVWLGLKKSAAAISLAMILPVVFPTCILLILPNRQIHVSPGRRRSHWLRRRFKRAGKQYKTAFKEIKEIVDNEGR